MSKNEFLRMATGEPKWSEQELAELASRYPKWVAWYRREQEKADTPTRRENESEFVAQLRALSAHLRGLTTRSHEYAAEHPSFPISVDIHQEAIELMDALAETFSVEYIANLGKWCLVPMSQEDWEKREAMFEEPQRPERLALPLPRQWRPDPRTPRPPRPLRPSGGELA